MILTRRKPQRQSIFKYATQRSFASSGLMTITFPADVLEPGDTIFLNHRSSTGTLADSLGWTVIGTVSGLTSFVRTVKPTDTGTYSYNISGGNNHSCHIMVVSGTIGYVNQSLTNQLSGAPVVLAPIAIQKNSTVLIYFTSAGAFSGTGASLTPSDYTVALTTGVNIQSVYKQFFEPTTEGFTLTWTGGTAANSRVTRIEILGNT